MGSHQEKLRLLEARRAMYQFRLDPGSLATQAWLKLRMEKVQMQLTSASSLDDVRKLQGQFAECKALLDCFNLATLDEVVSNG